MRQNIIVLDEAEDELIEAQNWYETQRPGLGQEFRSAIEERWSVFSRRPLAASPIVNVPSSISAGEFRSNGFPIPSCSLATARIFGLLHLPISIGDQAIGEND
jgi:hypothetical protein